ncbi:Guanosine-diphosphatase [Coccidioides posadasii str. Silveira]|uniref:guanosine-diphosphatase n=3 Tax=Coccidioides posadasii TaxID=199306 RepID=E9CV21_COCPS|nr:guanosine-diphosphatase, putative [Coccidioides posadasii C735 delta SOWgp]EER24860.1 guanosine-diphosphatase, putative [Coccidioides posadasii C735 delta SOWgp]EFW21212.1 GDA1/CD39 nucleoside phosphatase [Coccidioides posadasii str. Silveira]KMM71618.1 guanosine-diphosphatase [Coccidioides posadasii RMSCC 3488]QVM12808.1 Guanosine-diphosphatase [Coccidioides posadasii str. Silveira]|eukprot:XP_003067005.1 guanosine-diphosphatase, putative [Coccidioides posadasii C735 delta SOWgp]
MSFETTVNTSTSTPLNSRSSLRRKPTTRKRTNRKEKRLEILARRGDQSLLELGKSCLAVVMTQSQRTRYLKTGGILALLLFFIYILSPSSNPSTSIGSHTTTSKCTKPHHPSKSLIQYALMIDAGSTGSRIHVYRFNNCGPTPELEHEEFKMTEKRKGGAGLSSYGEDAEGAAKSLDPLMQVALDTVPEEYRSCSPVAVKATAGLRMLGPELSQKILEAVRHRLETVYPFPVVSKEQGGVEIMDGKDEGVYAWITTNYLLGNIGSPEQNPTAAIFDLGGGSTQIVFEPIFKVPDQMEDGDHKYELTFGGRKFTLYQHSHLGYGLMAARNAVHKAIVETMHTSNGEDRSWLSDPIINPCVGPGMEAAVNVTLAEDHPLGAKLQVKMVGPKEGSSAAAQCRSIADKILRKDAECALKPCSFNGIHQPSLAKTFAREDVYIFSYFYDRTAPLGMPDSFTLRDLQHLTSTVCSGEGSWGVFSGIADALEELKGRPEYCLDLNFMLSLLHHGYEMPLDREVKTAKKIDGNELGWCLGASLPLLSKDSGWQCRVKQIT